MDQLQRAYALMEVKAVSDERRTFTGIATTPETDRMGDTVNPLGAKFKNPLPLLHQHKHDAPIGTVIFKKPTKAGIEFEASIPVIEEAGLLKDRVDMAWGEIKHGLVRGVSIGFRSIKHAYLEGGGIDFQEIEIYELSSVSVPAQAQATIQSIKALDWAHRRADGAVRLVTHAAPKPEPRDLKGAVLLTPRR